MVLNLVPGPSPGARQYHIATPQLSGSEIRRQQGMDQSTIQTFQTRRRERCGPVSPYFVDDECSQHIQYDCGARHFASGGEIGETPVLDGMNLRMSLHTSMELV